MFAFTALRPAPDITGRSHCPWVLPAGAIAVPALVVGFAPIEAAGSPWAG